MEKTVLFRDLEERDIDFIYKCKNDKKLNSMIVGNWHPFTREEAEDWVHGGMGEHDTYKYWAICTNDDEKRIVGWTSLSAIDNVNMKVCLHGTVIGDAAYRDGFAMFETLLFCMDYCFNTLKMNRIYGTCLSDHPISPYLLMSLGFTLEGTRRKDVWKNNTYHDLLEFGLLKSEYNDYLKDGEIEINRLIRKFLKYRKNS